MDVRAVFASYFAGLAVVLTFYPIYLRDLGLSGREIAYFFALGSFIQIGIPVFWGWYSDRRLSADRVLRVLCGGALVSAVALAFARDARWLLIAYGLHLVFAAPVLDMAESVVLDRSRSGEDYGRVRSWGSLSFALTTVVMGAVLSTRARSPDAIIPWCYVALWGAALLAALQVTGRRGAHAERVGSAFRVLRERRFLFLLGISLLHSISHAPYRSFLSLFMRDRGIDIAVVGQVLTVSVLLEALAFRLCGRLLERFSLSGLLAAAFAGNILRALLTGSTDSPIIICAAQLMNFLTFGVYWAVALRWLRDSVPPGTQTTAQTMLTAVTMGVGTIVGTLGTGVVYDARGDVGAAFLLGAMVEVLPLAAVVCLGRQLQPGRLVMVAQPFERG